MQTPKMYLLMQRYSYGITKAVVQRCSVKELLLKISRNLQENTGAGVFFNKVEGLSPVSLLKKSPAKLFLHEFCEIF